MSTKTIPPAEAAEEVRKYLALSSHKHLQDCLHLVAEPYQTALCKMIRIAEEYRQQKRTIALQVSEDVSAIVAGFPEKAAFCQPFLNTD